MARKLPWAAGAPTSTTVEPTPRPQKRIKTETPTSKSKSPAKPGQTTSRFNSDNATSTPTPTPSPRKPKPRDNRTRNLSSSPPPPGPPDVTPMIQGLDGDDAYMLVEDEFYSTAQQFTAHLHHAEYKRQLKVARERKRAAGDVHVRVPENATRAVRGRLERKELEERQGRGIGKVMGAGAGGLLVSSDVEDEEGEVEKEEEKVRDPWAGTSLAPLMRYDSGGGAAQGFGPAGDGTGTDEGGVVDHRRRGHGMTVEGGRSDGGANGVARAATEADASRRISGSGATSSSTRPSITEEKKATFREMPAPSRPAKEKYRLPEPKLVKKEESAKDKSRAGPKPSKTAAKKYKSFIDSLDDFGEDTFDQTQAQTQTRASQRPSPPEKPRIKREDKSKGKKDRSSRYDEIPIFLV
ncbi:hypothetical protein PMZ80_008360 [Knufia obscura]|uniref:Uncharacterized protein n=1 Tax=Knufia obscura TaxID=1635080 RepID=A0ABR0REL0_9EURO|nr:hypothetical protein PMZ80_008360 [Knufia obscura]